jgi:hypothetical protein
MTDTGRGAIDVINTREALIAELISRLNEVDQIICQRIINCLTGLGYAPVKENVRSFVLSFKNKTVNQTIAKIRFRDDKSKGVFYSIKFYACTNPPKKFTDAVLDAVSKSNRQYECSNCGICGAGVGERGYRCLLPDGTAFLRCGAYVVEIPCFAPEDVDGFNDLLKEQHAYFSARTKQALCVKNESRVL